jgi:hypothetical protein
MFDNNYLKEEKKIIRSDDNGDDNDDWWQWEHCQETRSQYVFHRCEIWASYSVGVKDSGLLGCYAE